MTKQLNFRLTTTEHKSLKDRYKKYVARTKGIEVVEFNAWAKGELLLSNK